MNKEHAINLMKQLQSVVKATPQEHNVIAQAIEFLQTLEQPTKAE